MGPFAQPSHEVSALDSRPFTHSRARFGAAIVAILLSAAACSSGGPSQVAIPPSATGSSVPAATATPEPTTAPAFPVILVDDEGTTVELAVAPSRIVSLTPATTEILFALGAGPSVVATTDFDDYPPEAVPLPDVASFVSVDVEKIVGLEADLVIAGGNNFNSPEAIAQLRSLGIPVLVVYAPDVATVLADIELVGRAVGASEAASELTAQMRAVVEGVATATKVLARPTVFYEIDAFAQIYTAADKSFLAEMIQLAGGRPITTGSTTNFEISLEVLVTADPDLILLGDAAYGVTAEQVAARPGWGGLQAVRAGAIRPVNDLIITRPGPRLVEGLIELARAIHPELTLPSLP